MIIERTASNRMAKRDQRGFYGDLQDAGVRPSVEEGFVTTIERRSWNSFVWKLAPR